MDVLWLVLDSLSFTATPFAPDGPDTLPTLSSLADEAGIVFTNAYVPGPKSPSSHGSFLTGRLPSQTGMHEAYPRFDADIPTVADALGETHRSLLVSSNPFLFNGLDERFDETAFLNDREYLLFDGATDPTEFKWERGYDSPVEKYLDFLVTGGKPIRSLCNALSYRVHNARGGNTFLPVRAQSDPLAHQYVETMNERIRAFLDGGDDAFVLANYMDVHPPLNASEKALAEFAPDIDRDDPLVGASGERLRTVVEETGFGRLYDLYHAAIWDLDRRLGPMVRQAVGDGAVVVVTADHGAWFRQDGLTDEKLHVPLVVFGPALEPGVVEETVNLVQLPATTTRLVDADAGAFAGPSLLDVSESQVSVTEYLRGEGGGPVDPYGDSPTVRHDIVGIKDRTRVDCVDGEVELTSEDDAHDREIREVVNAVRSGSSDHRTGSVEYDDATKRRLEDLGYL